MLSIFIKLLFDFGSAFKLHVQYHLLIELCSALAVQRAIVFLHLLQGIEYLPIAFKRTEINKALNGLELNLLWLLLDWCGGGNSDLLECWVGCFHPHLVKPVLCLFPYFLKLLMLRHLNFAWILHISTVYLWLQLGNKYSRSKEAVLGSYVSVKVEAIIRVVIQVATLFFSVWWKGHIIFNWYGITYIQINTFNKSIRTHEYDISTYLLKDWNRLLILRTHCSAPTAPSSCSSYLPRPLAGTANYPWELIQQNCSRESSRS